MNSRLSALLVSAAATALIAATPLSAQAQQVNGLYVAGGFGVNWRGIL